MDQVYIVQLARNRNFCSPRHSRFSNFHYLVLGRGAEFLNIFDLGLDLFCFRKTKPDFKCICLVDAVFKDVVMKCFHISQVVQYSIACFKVS